MFDKDSIKESLGAGYGKTVFSYQHFNIFSIHFILYVEIGLS